MPLNYLLHRHQIELMRAAKATTIEVRRTHEAFAAAYADCVREAARASGATTAPLART